MTISEVKQRLKLGGNHFFDKATMRFFGSRVESSLYKNNTFITSEYTSFDRTNRAYTVRYYDEQTNSIKSISKFGEFSSLSLAKDFAKKYKTI